MGGIKRDRKGERKREGEKDMKPESLHGKGSHSCQVDIFTRSHVPGGRLHRKGWSLLSYPSSSSFLHAQTSISAVSPFRLFLSFRPLPFPLSLHPLFPSIPFSFFSLPSLFPLLYFRPSSLFLSSHPLFLSLLSSLFSSSLPSIIPLILALVPLPSLLPPSSSLLYFRPSSLSLFPFSLHLSSLSLSSPLYLPFPLPLFLALFPLPSHSLHVLTFSPSPSIFLALVHYLPLSPSSFLPSPLFFGPLPFSPSLPLPLFPSLFIFSPLPHSPLPLPALHLRSLFPLYTSYLIFWPSSLSFPPSTSSSSISFLSSRITSPTSFPSISSASIPYDPISHQTTTANRLPSVVAFTVQVMYEDITFSFLKFSLFLFPSSLIFLLFVPHNLIWMGGLCRIHA
ncbi:hypothetical protein C7M84_025044 [Penaeus vannamei]|uniref:Uncharacterized protein n=1 Tax=Penaeus vannamei TaxID=6689 RepID=A0A3R7QKJ5_PENVA|nr:hypothetical protein C7M84_025044 [Penaeus vannamei]